MSQSESTSGEASQEESEGPPEMQVLGRGDEIRVTFPARLVDEHDVGDGDEIGFQVRGAGGTLTPRLTLNPEEGDNNVRKLNYNSTTERLDIRFPIPLARYMGLYKHVRDHEVVTATFVDVTPEGGPKMWDLELFPVLAPEAIDERSDMDPLFSQVDERRVEAEDSDSDETHLQVYRVTLEAELTSAYEISGLTPVVLQGAIYEGKASVAMRFRDPGQVDDTVLNAENRPAVSLEHEDDAVSRNIHRNSRYDQYAVGFPAAVVEAIGMDGMAKIPLTDGILFVPQ